MKTLFLDTNIFLHYRSIEELDWLTLTQSSEVLLIVPPLVLRELDKHKHSHPSAKVKKRARSVVARLNELFERSETALLRPGTTLTVIPLEPTIDFAAHQLRSDISDDFLIGTIIEYRQNHPQADVAVVAADYGLKLKAKAKGLAIVSLDDTFRLPEEDDSSEKRIKQLEAELRESKISIPKLEIHFAGKTQHIRFVLVGPKQQDSNFITDNLTELRRKYPPLQSPSAKLTPVEQAMLGAYQLGMIPEEEYTRYNQELAAFFERYECYLRDLHREDEMMARTFSLNMELVNTGTCPAEDIDLHLHFPDGFQLFDEDDRPQRSDPPRPPDRPRTMYDRLGQRLSMSLPDSYGALTKFSSVGNVSSPSIERTNSYDVRWHVRKLKHFLSEPLNPLYFTFDSFETAASFQVEYTLHMANAPKQVSGQLQVIIEKR